MPMPSSGSEAQIFVASGPARHVAMRVAASVLALMLVAWLAAVGTGVIGFGPLPRISLSGGGDPEAGQGGAPASARGQARQAAAEAASASGWAQAGARGATGAGGSPAAVSRAPGSRAASTPSAAGSTSVSGTGSGGNGGTLSTTSGNEASGSTSGSVHAQATDHAPAFTPPSTGERAEPVRGRSASAPGQAKASQPTPTTR